MECKSLISCALRLVPAGCVAVIALAANGCGGKSNASPQPAALDQSAVIRIPAQSPLWSRLALDTAKSQDVCAAFTAPATVEPNPAAFAKILPPLTGQIAALRVRLGDAVRKGEALLTINSPDYAAAVSGYILADRNLRRERQLTASGIASARELQQAEADYASAAGRLRMLGVSPEKAAEDGALVVRAPLSGKVVDFSAVQGGYVNDLTAPVMTLADLSTVWLAANVKENDIRFVAKNQPVQAVFAAYPDTVFDGKVLFVGDVLDPQTRSVPVRIAFGNRRWLLKPGMYATVTFIRKPACAVVVPMNAVVQIKDSSYVFRQIAPSEFSKSPVTLGAQTAGGIIVARGLDSGDVYISDNGVLLQ